jgi:hypothetical protein
MAIAPVLKTGVRKDLGVRIPRPPLDLRDWSPAGRLICRNFDVIGPDSGAMRRWGKVRDRMKKVRSLRDGIRSLPL